MVAAATWSLHTIVLSNMLGVHSSVKSAISQVETEPLSQRLRQVGAIVDENALPKIEPRVDRK